MLNISIVKQILPDKKEVSKLLGYNLKIFCNSTSSNRTFSVIIAVPDIIAVPGIVVQEMFQLYIKSKFFKNICGGCQLRKVEKKKREKRNFRPSYFFK